MPGKNGHRAAVYRALVEVGFIIFLFYSNLLMGEFTRSSHRTLGYALRDVVTPANLTVAVVAAVIGYVGFEYFRKQL